MPILFLFIIILGSGIGVITFFIIKSVGTPRKTSELNKALKQGKANAVIKAAKAIIAKDPRNSDAHYLLGQAYLMEHKTELALMEYKTVNQIGRFGTFCPERDFRQQIAELYEKYRQPEEALKEYLLLIKLEPQVSKFYYKAGDLFEQWDKSEKAENFYRKAIELDPKSGPAHFRLGQILHHSKKNVEAKRELETALKLQPENYKAYFYIGRILKDNHDYVNALHMFERAQRDPEQKVKALIERGTCYMGMNNFDSAIGELERAVKLSTDEGANETLYTRYFLAMCYEKTRKIDKAIDHWEKIYSKKTSFKDVAEKLSQYQELRDDDRVKDFLTVSMEEFYEICKTITQSMGLNVRDVSDIPNGCQILAVDSDQKWRGAKRMPRLIRFLRIAELIPETSVRSIHEEMKSISVTRGMIIASANF